MARDRSVAMVLRNVLAGIGGFYFGFVILDGSWVMSPSYYFIADVGKMILRAVVYFGSIGLFFALAVRLGGWLEGPEKRDGPQMFSGLVLLALGVGLAFLISSTFDA